jgi:uncharacterized protein (TIGR00251 family)
MDWLEQTKDGVCLRIRAQPRARKTEVLGLHDGALKIRLVAPPVDGKANQALVKFLARRLGVAPSAVRVIAGEKNRNKTLHVSGVSAAAVRAAFPIA